MNLPSPRSTRESAGRIPLWLVRVCLALLLIASVFQSVSLFSVSPKPGFVAGVAPYWILALLSAVLMLAYARTSGKVRWRALPRDLRVSGLFLPAFVVYAVISAFVLPFVFRGASVLAPRLGMNAQYLNPSTLSWSLSNAGQAAYILLNLFVFALMVLSIRSPEDFRVLYWVLLGASFLVLAFGIFQHLSVAYAPNRLYETAYYALHNNPGTQPYPVADPRTTSTFLEPSYFAGFAAALLAMGMTGYLFTGSVPSLVLCSAALYGIVMSESTLGWLLLPLALVLVAGLVAMRLRRQQGMDVDRRPIGRAPWLALSLALVLIFCWQERSLVGLLRGQRGQPPATAAVPSAEIPTQTVLAATPPAAPIPTQPVEAPPGVQAPGSQAPRPLEDRLLSMRFRLWADEFSIFHVTRETLFLGAGLGSNRPSSFLSYVVSNLGIPGLLAFAGFVFATIRALIKRIAQISPTTLVVAIGLFCYLLAMLAGLPDPSWPPFLWILAGFTFAGLALASPTAASGT